MPIHPCWLVLQTNPPSFCSRFSLFSYENRRLMRTIYIPKSHGNVWELKSCFGQNAFDLPIVRPCLTWNEASKTFKLRAEDGGWARQRMNVEMPTGSELTGVNMRLRVMLLGSYTGTKRYGRSHTAVSCRSGSLMLVCVSSRKSIVARGQRSSQATRHSGSRRLWWWGWR